MSRPTNECPWIICNQMPARLIQMLVFQRPGMTVVPGLFGAEVIVRETHRFIAPVFQLDWPRLSVLMPYVWLFDWELLPNAHPSTYVLRGEETIVPALVSGADFGAVCIDRFLPYWNRT